MASNLYVSYVYCTFPTLQICQEVMQSTESIDQQGLNPPFYCYDMYIGEPIKKISSFLLLCSVLFLFYLTIVLMGGGGGLILFPFLNIFFLGG